MHAARSKNFSLHINVNIEAVLYIFPGHSLNYLTVTAFISLFLLFCNWYDIFLDVHLLSKCMYVASGDSAVYNIHSLYDMIITCQTMKFDRVSA